jgi:Protein of unknown function (DUF1207)
MRKATAAALLMAVAIPAAAAAQNRERPPTLLPGVRYFESPVADPIEPRFAIGLAYTNLFDRQGPERAPYTRPPGPGREVQAAAAIGTTIPLILLHQGENGGVVVSAVAGVYARFRIERPSRDAVGEDWTVGMPVEMSWGASMARFRIIHRSSHLGDELAQATGARRIEVGGEAVDALLARRLGALRVYGGAGWIFHSNTDNTAILRSRNQPDRFTVQAGADGEFHPFSNERLSIVAGADWQSAERTDWRSTFGLAGGLRLESGTREARLIARYVGGVSTIGQFFLTNEQAWSLELFFGT